MEETNLGQLVWTFLNSPIGLTVVGGAIMLVLGKLMKDRPKWEGILQENKGLIVDAIKWAEKTIPDDSPNKALCRLDEALKFMLKVDASLAKKKPEDIKKAITTAHGEREVKKNGEGIG